MNESKNQKKRVTIKDVAKLSDVSIATVSYVLNDTPGQSISDETRKKVLQFANILGYECNTVAKYLATGKSNTVSALIKNIDPVASHYYVALLTELSRILWRSSYGLKIVDYEDGLKRNTDCDAYVTIGLTEKEFRLFADTKMIPVIALDSVFDDFLFYRINDDYENLYATAKAESGADKVVLLTYALPEETLGDAAKYFDGVKVINDFGEDIKFDSDTRYVTVSGFIHKCFRNRADIVLQNSSFALKASAAAEATVKAIRRTVGNTKEHDIRV